MKNVNLTGLFLAMVAKFDVSGFELTSIIPQNTEVKEPIDVMIDFTCNDITLLDINEINKIINENIAGEVKQTSVKIKGNIIHVYVEFADLKVKA